MQVFEDAGYFCVDNLPAEMIRSLSELFMHEGSKVERAAVACDSRGGEFLGALAGLIDPRADAAGGLEGFYAERGPLLGSLLPQYVTEGRAPLMVAIGCTGGGHRSVAIAER